MLWVSVVPNPSLGLLMGKDLMRALGVTLDFDGDLFFSKRLGIFNRKLLEMRAGHYKLDLMPHQPNFPMGAGWTKPLGPGGVVQLPRQGIRHFVSQAFQKARQKVTEVVSRPDNLLPKQSTSKRPSSSSSPLLDRASDHSAQNVDGTSPQQDEEQAQQRRVCSSCHLGR